MPRRRRHDDISEGQLALIERHIFSLGAALDRVQLSLTPFKPHYDAISDLKKHMREAMKRLRQRALLPLCRPDDGIWRRRRPVQAEVRLQPLQARYQADAPRAAPRAPTEEAGHPQADEGRWESHLAYRAVPAMKERYEVDCAGDAYRVLDPPALLQPFKDGRRRSPWCRIGAASTCCGLGSC